MSSEPKLLPVGAGIAVSLIFGFSFLFSKQSLSMMAPFELLAHRFSLAAVFLIILLGMGIIRIKWNGKMLIDLLPLAFFQPILYFLGETTGVKLTTASESGLVISLIPVAVTLLGSVFLKEKADFKRWLFVILSVLGVVFIIFSQRDQGVSVHGLGILALLTAVMAAAIYNILSRKFSRSYSPLEITVVMMISGAIFFNVFWLCTIRHLNQYFSALTSWNSLSGLLYLGLLSSVVAFFLLNYMLKKMAASQVATFVNLTTVVSVLAGVILRGEPFGLFHIIGGIFILIGVWGTTLFNLKRQ